MAVLVCLSVLTGCKQTSFMDRVNADFQQKKEMLLTGHTLFSDTTFVIRKNS